MDTVDLLAFKVVIEPDEDLWQSYYPAWEHLGAATFGNTPEEAAGNIKEVLEMIVEEIEEGDIEWPIEPCAGWEFSRPSIQDAPDFLQLKCAPEFPDAIASHGGLPVDGLSVADPNDFYRLIYVAVDDVLAAIHARRTLRETRTGGLVSRIFTPEAMNGRVERKLRIQ
jgi:predicted RNase H-like HicB family nuclease